MNWIKPKDDDEAIHTRVRVPLMMSDSARMMTRDHVRGMPLDQAAALPLYDNVRGSVISGMAAERYAALMDGAVVDVQPTLDNGQSGFVNYLTNAWKNT